MEILEQVDDLIQQIKFNSQDIKLYMKQIKHYEKIRDKVLSQESKNGITEAQIKPRKNNIRKLNLASKQARNKLDILEYIILDEEIKSRNAKSVIPKSDYSKTFKLFRRSLKRFRSFEAYLTGRQAEVKKAIMTNILRKLINQNYTSRVEEYREQHPKNPELTNKLQDEFNVKSQKEVFKNISKDDLSKLFNEKIKSAKDKLLASDSASMQYLEDFWKTTIQLAPSDREIQTTKDKENLFDQFQKSKEHHSNNLR